MSDQHPYFRTDYFRPPHGVNVTSPEEEKSVAAAASREASEREMAYLRALGRPPLPKPELPPIKAPILPQDFAQRVAALDEEMYSRGVAIDADKLLTRGKERFASLLAADRKARRYAPVGDLTSFESVQRGLHAFETPLVPRRTTREQVAGSGKEREAVRAIAGWADLWKATNERQEVLQDLYAFHDEFAALCFGHSILERLSPDGRLRSRFFCGGKGAKVDLVRDWLSVTGGSSLVSVTLLQPLWHLVSWLANEQASAPSPVDLAKDFFAVRSPSQAQVRMAESIFDGFLLGYDGWALWQLVGRRTRTVTEQGRLEAWRTALAKRYPGIASFHAEVSAAFFQEIGHGWDSHRQFEPPRYRAFLDSCLQKRLRQVSALLALGLEETFKGAVVARFEGQVLVEAKHKLKDKRATIGRQLAAAFPSATFPITFEEVQP